MNTLNKDGFFSSWSSISNFNELIPDFAIYNDEKKKKDEYINELLS